MSEQDLTGYHGDPARDLIEKVSQLEDLQATPGWQTFRQLAEEAIRKHEALLSAGHFNEITEYKFSAGWLNGARQLLALPDQLKARLEQMEQDDRMQRELEENADFGYAHEEVTGQ